MRRIITACLAAGVAGAVALAGCGSGGGGGDDADTARSFVIGAGDVDGIDPVQTKTLTAQMVVANLYANVVEQEFTRGPDGYLQGTGEYINGIVDEYDVSDDGDVLTFRLVEGLSFADGSALTADDVVYTMQRTLSDASYVSGSSSVFLHIDDAESQIEALDEHTVQVRLNTAAPAANAFLSLGTFGILDAATGHANAGADGAATEFFVKNATPSGPFTLESWSEGESVQLRKNDHYVHADEVFAEQITVLNMPDEDQRFLAVRNGDIDIALELSPRLVREAESDPSLMVYSIPSTRFYYMGLNPKIEPFDDPLVRQAVATALPYETLMNEVMLGQASAAYGPVPHGMDTSIAPSQTATQYERNLDEARRLLDEAGVDELTIDLSISSADQIAVDSAVYIQSALSEIGVHVRISPMADADFETRSKDEQLGFIISHWSSWVQDPFFQMRALLLTDRQTNRTGFANAEFDDLVLRGIDEGDPQAREQLSAQAQQIVVDEAAFVGLFKVNEAVVTRPDVDGITQADDMLLRLRYLTRR